MSVATPPAHGSVAASRVWNQFLNAYTYWLTYTPTDKFVGDDSFTYTADDGFPGGTATGTVTVHMTNNPPTAPDASATTTAGTLVTAVPAISDPENDPLTVSVATPPEHGSVVVSQYWNQFLYQYQYQFTYTPVGGFTGTDSFTYTADDGFPGGTATGTINITVNPPVVTVAKVNDTSEGGIGYFRITRTGGTGGSLTVGLNVSGTSTPDADYTSLGTSATIPAGFQSVDVAVPARRDNLVEGNETVILALAAGDGYTVGSPDTASLTISDDPPVISMTTTNTTEGGTATVTFTRTGGDQTQPLTVAYDISGTATPGDRAVNPAADYAPLLGTAPEDLYHGSVTFDPNWSTAVVPIATFRDNVVEQNGETVALTIYPTSTYTLLGGAGNAMATAVITDDPPVVTVSAAGSPSEQGPTGGSITLTRTGGDINQSLTVTYTVASGSGMATPGTDYELLNGTTEADPYTGTVTFLGGQPTVLLPLTPKADQYIEESEQVQVSVGGGGTSYVVGASSSAGLTIQDWVSLTMFGITADATQSTELRKLAEFTDLSDDSNLDNMTVQIGWGDGQTSDGMLFKATDGSGVCEVAGDHIYATAGNYPIQINLYYNGTLVGTGSTQATVGAYTPPDQIGYHPDNFAPIAVDDYYFGSFSEGFSSYTTDAGPPMVGVLANDIDLDNDLSVVEVTDGEFGTVQMNPDGSFRYIPGPNFTGEDTFQYWVSDGTTQATAFVHLEPLPDGVAPLGNSTLIADSASWQIPDVLTLRNNLDALQQAKARDIMALGHYYGQAIAKAGVNSLIAGPLADKVFALSQGEVALWTDYQGASVNGGVKFGGDLLDNNSPFGMVNYTNSQFSAGFNIPQFDAQGQFANVATLTLDKNGLSGMLPVGRDSWINFQNGIAAAQVSTGDFIYGYDRTTKSLTVNQINPKDPTKLIPLAQVTPGDVTFTLKDLTFTVGPKVFSFSSPKFGDFAIEMNDNKTIKSLNTTLNLGGTRSLSLSYSDDLQTRSLTAALNTKSINFSFTYAPNTYSFSGSYSFNVFGAPAAPINGFVTVTNDNTTRTTTFTFGIGGTW